MRKVAVIGAGAAGLMAALSASEHGADVTLYERNNRIGKKLLATGNGRCNYSNINASAEHYNSGAKTLIHSIFKQYDAQWCVDYFQRLGIEPKLEQEGKLFPRSEQAGSFLDIFLYQIADRKITLLTEKEVKSININQSGFEIMGKTYDAVILTAGGKSMPNSGSDGRAYTLAENFGHSCSKLYPAIVQLKLKENYLSALQGVKIKARAEFYADGKLIFSDSGDVLFTNYGISGPPILQLSRYYVRSSAKKASLKINLFPELSFEEVIEILTRRKALDKPLVDYCIGFLHKKLIHTVLKLENLDKKRRSSSLTDAEIHSLAKRLTAWELTISSTMSWQNAQVTVGGIKLSEIGHNLESSFMPSLYFAGEMLDVDGQCGGYNLQWAWASGYLAGQNAAVGG